MVAALHKSGVLSSVIVWPGKSPNKCDKCRWCTSGSSKSSACKE